MREKVFTFSLVLLLTSVLTVAIGNAQSSTFYPPYDGFHFSWADGGGIYRTENFSVVDADYGSGTVTGLSQAGPAWGWAETTSEYCLIAPKNSLFEPEFNGTWDIVIEGIISRYTWVVYVSTGPLVVGSASGHSFGRIMLTLFKVSQTNGVTRTEKVGQIQKTLFDITVNEAGKENEKTYDDMPFSLKLEDVILQAQTGYFVEVKFIVDTEASASLGSTISGHAGGGILGGKVDSVSFKNKSVENQRIFTIYWMNISYPIAVLSNSNIISAFSFNQTLKQISFNLVGISGTHSFCNVTIPKTLMEGEPWTVKLNGTNWPFTQTNNETHSFIYFNYTHASTYEVIIQGTWVVPEFSSTSIFALFMTTTLTAIVLLKAKRKYKLKFSPFKLKP